MWRALLLCAGLAGCALVAPAPERVASQLDSADATQRFTLTGRVAVRTGEQRYAGTLRWERRPDEEMLRLSTPLGQGVAEVVRDARGLTLTDAEGYRHSAADIDTLARQIFGVPVPLSGLVYWLSARPHPNSPHQAFLDAAQRVAALDQDGWHIEYDRYAARTGRELPGRLLATRSGDIEFRLVVDAWEVP